MSNVTDITTTLQAFQRGVNAETVRNQAKHIRALEASLRKLAYCLRMGIPVALVDLEQAERLCE